MKKILVVLALLAAFGVGYSVSGKIYVRLNTSGPELEYRNGAAGGTWFLQQQKEGTGFDLYFDNFGLTYRMLSPFPVPYVTTPTIGESGDYKASTPGYFQFKDLKLIPGVGLSIGIMWHQLFAGATSFMTNNTNTCLVGDYTNQSTAYNRLYFTLGFNTKIGDSLEIKTYDWNHCDFMVNFGSSLSYFTNTNAVDNTNVDSRAGNVTNDNKTMFGWSATVIPQILFNADPLVMTISPSFVGNSGMTREVINSNAVTNQKDTTAMTWGINVFAVYGINDFMSAVGSVGYVYDVSYVFDRSIASSGTTITNTLTYEVAQFVPWFVGVKLNIGGKAKMTLGWGYMWEVSKVGLNGLANGTNLNESANYAKFGWDVASSGLGINNSGPNAMDIPFLRFNGVATFAQYWQLGLDGAVTINDPWESVSDKSINYHQNTRATVLGGNYTYTSSGQLLKFANLLCWDQGQGFIKYEDNAVLIKGEFAQRFAAPGAGTSLLGLFSFLTLGVKF